MDKRIQPGWLVFEPDSIINYRPILLYILPIAILLYLNTEVGEEITLTNLVAAPLKITLNS